MPEQRSPSAEPLRFDEFAVPTVEEWHAATLASLKGRSFESLIRLSAETIPLRPLYFAADEADLPATNTLPGQPPYLRGTQPQPRPWLIAQEITALRPADANAALRHDLAHGQNAINLPLDDATRLGRDPDQSSHHHGSGVSLASVADLATLFDGIDLTTTPLLLHSGSAVLPILSLLAAYAEQSGQPINQWRGSLGGDPLGELAQTGHLPLALDAAYDEAAQAARWLSEQDASLAVFTLHGDAVIEAGGSAVEELAFVLASAVATLRALIDREVDINQAAARCQLAFGIGENLFMEIAKLRAARLLWSQIVAAFGGDSDAQKATIHARTARRNKTKLDPYVNMLRATTEAFAAAVGGVDSLHVSPFDECIRPPDTFSRRIARNVHVILQEESSLNQLVDPPGGAYYIEWLTDQVAQKAWALFQEIESQGGLAASLMSGWLQGKVATSAETRAHALATRQQILVGTNQYANLTETPLADETDHEAIVAQRLAEMRDWRLEIASAETAQISHLKSPIPNYQSSIPSSTLHDLTSALRPDPQPVSVAPLHAQRWAEPFEALRSAEIAAQPPRIFLATMGPLRQHKARADFVRGFLEVGGFDVVVDNGFASAQEAADATIESGVSAVVLCSTDKTYPELVKPFVERVKATRPNCLVLLAGQPPEQDAYRAAGIDAFIHLGADCLALNRWLQSTLTPTEQGVSA